MFYRDGIDIQHDGHDACLKLYRGVLALVPNFRKTLEEFGDDFQSIMDLITVVRRIAITLFLLRAPIDGQGIP